jgi:hypothetical protein
VKTTIRAGEICPTCGLRRDELLADGSRILYGQGVGQLIITEEGRKFVIKNLVEDVMLDIIKVAAHVATDPKLSADDNVYVSARKLLHVVTDIPDRVR